MKDQLPSSEEVSTPQDEGLQKYGSAIEQTSEGGVSIPWDAYFTSYFIQGILMQLLLGNVGVFLYNALGLDWLVLTASFFIMVIPVVSRPLFAFVADKRPASLSSLLIFGLFLVTTGTGVASLGTLSGAGGLWILTVGFSVGVVGATILNVVADSHIVRLVPLDKSARVNSYKRIFAFLGVLIAQLGYIFIVGENMQDLTAWALYFTLPAICSIITFAIISFKKKSLQILPVVTGLPQFRAQWLANTSAEGKNQKDKLFPIVLLIFILFLFNLPDGLLETPWEIFITKTYGSAQWVTYEGLIVLGGVVAGVGFILARRSGTHAPEWDFLWFAPITTAYYALLLFMPPFEVVIGVTIGLQIVAGFMQVRILQAMQGHSYFKRAGLTFQIFMVTYQGGKFLGIGLSGIMMTYGGYLGLFFSSVVIWLIIFALSIGYWVTTRRARVHKG